MGFKSKEVESSGSTGPRQEVIAVGNYPARLVQLIDLGLQTQRPYMGNEKPPVHMLRTTYELCTEFCKDDDGNEDTDRPRWVGEEFPFYNLSVERAKSTQRYNGIDPLGENDGDWELLVGRDCTVTIVHNADKKDASKVYANIGSVSPSMKGMATPELVNDAVVWSLDDPDVEQFNKFPDFIKNKILSNLNFAGSVLEARLGGEPDPAENDETDAAEHLEENPFG